uniref:Uncharacterized protein n=1 Tax=Cannabis sativa TaxID=3483 RepID=A0A803Q769_CANSA
MVVTRHENSTEPRDPMVADLNVQVPLVVTNPSLASRSPRSGQLSKTATMFRPAVWNFHHEIETQILGVDGSASRDPPSPTGRAEPSE